MTPETPATDDSRDSAEVAERVTFTCPACQAEQRVRRALVEQVLQAGPAFFVCPACGKRALAPEAPAISSDE